MAREEVEFIRELVKYRNDLNDVIFKNWNAKEQNIFFAIVSRCRTEQTKKTDTVTLPFSYLMRLSGNHYAHHKYRFIRDMKRVYHKALNMTIYRRHGNTRFDEWVLFTHFSIDSATQKISIDINPKLIGVLTDLAKNFTRFSMLSFGRLTSTYSKTMFRICNQFRTTGLVNMPIKKFKILLGVPKGYSTSEMTQSVIRPIQIELTPLIRGFDIESVRHGIGGKITGYRITFTPQLHKQDYTSKGYSEDRRRMRQNIIGSGALSPKLKKKALRHVDYVLTRHTKKHKQEPMKEFNHMLKTTPLYALEMYNRMHKNHDPTVHFSPYQMRKLRKRIKKLKQMRRDQLLELDAEERKSHEVKGQFKPIDDDNGHHPKE